MSKSTIERERNFIITIYHVTRFPNHLHSSSCFPFNHDPLLPLLDTESSIPIQNHIYSHRTGSRSMHFEDVPRWIWDESMPAVVNDGEHGGQMDDREWREKECFVSQRGARETRMLIVKIECMRLSKLTSSEQNCFASSLLASLIECSESDLSSLRWSVSFRLAPVDSSRVSRGESSLSKTPASCSKPLLGWSSVESREKA